jgi:hypothetical protein
MLFKITLKKKVFYETKKGSSRVTREDPFLVSQKEGFVWNFYFVSGKNGFVPKVRYEIFTGKSQKVSHTWFRTEPFQDHVQKVSYKWFRTEPFEDYVKKVSSRWFRTKPFKAYSTHEEALPTEKSFSS